LKRPTRRFSPSISLSPSRRDSLEVYALLSDPAATLRKFPATTTTIPHSSMPEPELLDLSERDLLLLEAADLLSRLFREADLRAALIGGHAVNSWHRPRFTDDFDFTVAADRAGIAVLQAGLEESGFRIRRNQDAGEPDGPDFLQLQHPVTDIVVDLLVAKTPFQERLLERAVSRPVLPFPVATVEDLIILKLIANRPIDQQDVINLGRRADVDWAYIEAEAPTWHIEQRLARLREAVGA
jgi:hypothetical protein